MQHRFLLSWQTCAVCACLLALALPLCAQAAKLDKEDLALVALVNHYRQQHGVSALRLSAKLNASTAWMSRDMAKKDYFSHTDSLGRDPFQRMAAFGYAYNTYKGENIASGNGDAEATFQQWKHSPSHNRTMLNPKYKVMGIARAYAAGTYYGWYWTNDFGGR